MFFTDTPQVHKTPYIYTKKLNLYVNLLFLCKKKLYFFVILISQNTFGQCYYMIVFP